MYAVCNINNSKYLGSKNLKIWSYEINEHCLIISTKETLTVSFVQDFVGWLKEQIPVLIKTHPEHMQSYLTGVIISPSGIDNQAMQFINKLKYSKSFLWGLQGWCDLRLLVVDLATGQVISNKKAEEVKKVYQPKFSSSFNYHD
jgi:hypothetical protein